MAFEWINNDVNTMSVTFTDSNITLNKAACRYFEESSYVLLGYDVDNHQIGIKPVKKIEIENKVYPKNQLHKLSLGKSYGRISNKNFLKGLSDYTHLDFASQSTYKLEAKFDVKKQILIIPLEEVL